MTASAWAKIQATHHPSTLLLQACCPVTSTYGGRGQWVHVVPMCPVTLQR